jgi:hypothetical protein
VRQNGSQYCQHAEKKEPFNKPNKFRSFRVEKCMQQIKQVYHVKNLGRKVRKFIAGCDNCQKVKFPNRAVVIEERSHLPTKPGSFCAIDLFGSLPTSRRGG